MTNAMACAVVMTDADRGLSSSLKLGRVPQSLIDHMTKTLKMELLEDFVYYVSAKTFDDDIKALADSVPECKDNRLARARLTSAWTAGRDAMTFAQSAMNSGSSTADLDDALPEGSALQCEADWLKTYPGIVIDVNLQPADSFLGRTWREFRRRSATVIETKRMRTVLADRKPKETQSVPLNSTVSMNIGHDDELSIRSVVDYYWALRTQAYAWALAGNFEVDSISKPGTKVRFFGLTQSLDYADNCLRLVHEHGGGSRSWLEQRDLLCRGKLVTYIRRGWPGGEGLEKALAETYLDWHSSVTNVGTPERRTRERNSNSPREPRHSDSPREPDPKKRRATISTLPGGQQICKPFVDGRGCKLGKGCKSAHNCDLLNKDGTPCKGKHTRAQHKD